ncbi:hypothetical protein [Halomonas sp. PBN3]|uniref:hypothetical protein n=1 Tax=Halomonas sp. PBN3 TaxID=1397528 RepID=UPI0003B8223E|nr:hypothetical protein [Halomonas sp. PBN3]ERS81720.1 hypothetical protein Q671_13050 [Halomonas sp. PBN3]
MTPLQIKDRIDDHTRQAWALSEFLLAYYNDAEEDRSTMSNEVMSGLMENMADHLRAIRELNSEQEGDS